MDHNLFFGDGTASGTDYQEGDQLLVDPTNADFQLGVGSPAIDNGAPEDAPASDFDGVSRPQGAAFDIGAFEGGG